MAFIIADEVRENGFISNTFEVPDLKNVLVTNGRFNSTGLFERITRQLESEWEVSSDTDDNFTISRDTATIKIAPSDGKIVGKVSVKEDAATPTTLLVNLIAILDVYFNAELKLTAETALYETTIIPRGTILFRGMNSTESLTSDFAGVKVEGSKAMFCLTDYHNVFFYPFPFVANAVAPYTYIAVYVVMYDIKLINLILPSKYNRADRDRNVGGVTSCSSISNMGCNLSGHEYDPCVDYKVVPKGSVAGMIAIAKADARSLMAMRPEFIKFANIHFATYKDSRGLIGVPELILHPTARTGPQRRKGGGERRRAILDFGTWYDNNRNSFNYNYLRILPNQTDAIYDYMNTLRKGGVMMNKRTGFFQISRLSGDSPDLIPPDLSLKGSEDMVFKRATLYKEPKEKYAADTIPAQFVASVDFGAATLTPEADTVFAKYGGSYLRIPSTVTNETTGEVSKHPLVILMNKKYYVASVIPGADLNNLKNYISIYEVTKGRTFDQYILGNPAREINGLFHRYIKKKQTGPATVPASLTIYAGLDREGEINSVVTFTPEAMAFLKSVATSIRYMNLDFDSEDYGIGEGPQAVFKINDKYYTFWFTPEGDKLLAATEEDREYINQPLNAQITAYEVTIRSTWRGPQAIIASSRQPAVEINALLADYLKRTVGASRRRTFRRARTHGALDVVAN
jgi:hypothetical protein